MATSKQKTDLENLANIKDITSIKVLPLHIVAKNSSTLKSKSWALSK